MSAWVSRASRELSGVATNVLPCPPRHGSFLISSPSSCVYSAHRTYFSPPKKPSPTISNVYHLFLQPSSTHLLTTLSLYANSPPLPSPPLSSAPRDVPSESDSGRPESVCTMAPRTDGTDDGRVVDRTGDENGDGGRWEG